METLFQKPDMPYSNLTISHETRLGGGVYGEVYPANWRCGEDETKRVAVKLLKDGVCNENATEIRNEIHFLR